MKRYTYQTLSFITVILLMTSCLNDLNTTPINKRVSTAATIYDNPDAYKEFLAKLYGAMTLTGQRGEYGQPEISAPDEGTTSFMRMLWYAQEITTDECLSAWGDAGITEYHSLNWSSQNGYIALMYQRIFINIAYCNEYIREVSARIPGLSTEMQTDVTRYVAEARFMRALYYYYAMDLWGNVPFVTEADGIGAYLPRQIQRKDLFTYIENELKAIEPMLADAGANEYARADKAALWTLLSRMYLNAEVYTQTDRYADCITYTNKIISSGVYTLNPSYANLFRADNDKLRNEIIMPIAEDGNNGRNYGGVTFIIHAEVGPPMDADNDFGIGSGGWSGSRMTTAFVNNSFSDPSGATDSRAMFFAGTTSDITDITVFTEGYKTTKWKNLTSTGEKGQNATFVDTDFPLFRLGDVYLMYAEATVRGGSGGDPVKALDYVNQLRTRAYGSASGNITAADLTLDFLIAERGREMYWETTRRTDLIRFGLFTSDTFLWDWKGNVKNGTGADSKYNLFCLPASDLAINTNLVQNSGY